MVARIARRPVVRRLPPDNQNDERAELRAAIDGLTQARAIDRANEAALRAAQDARREAATKLFRAKAATGALTREEIAEEREDNPDFQMPALPDTPEGIKQAREDLQAAQDEHDAAVRREEFAKQQASVTPEAERKLAEAVNSVVRVHLPEVFERLQESRTAFFTALQSLSVLTPALTSEELNKVQVCRGMYWSEGLLQPEIIPHLRRWLAELRNDPDAPAPQV